MLRIHREGHQILASLTLGLVLLHVALFYFQPLQWLNYFLVLGSLLLWLFVLQFFRNPARHTPFDSSAVYSPADGKVVVIEETLEKEYYKEKRLQISVFMSPLNVHANRSPISGKVCYYQYHDGKYLVAWHPKSSELNERNSIVIESPQGISILVRQIAGAMARRICCYLQAQSAVVQGEEFGFIKFGSRVDVFLPLDSKINVKIGDKVKAGESVLAFFEEK